MFRHHGKTRTAKHNLQIASLLSFVAGIVNVAGFLAVQKLTTNVTGHFAFFVEQVFQLHYWSGFLYFLYIFFFFLGAFVSGFLVEWVARKNENTTYMLPLFIEIVLLLLVAILGDNLIENYANIIACTLLFAMGLQNALVTKISNAVVRTTHLTGLFTDLGIEMAQLFFLQTTRFTAKTVFVHTITGDNHKLLLCGWHCGWLVLQQNAIEGFSHCGGCFNFRIDL